MIIKVKAKKKVNLKISFSRPLRLKDVPPDAPNVLPSPVPFDCINIKPITTTETTICTTVSADIILVIIP